MNYINNATAACCVGFGDGDKIQVSDTYIMVDCETGEEVKVFVPGHTYRCEKRWALYEGYAPLDTFETKEKAMEAYNMIIDGLKETNTVIDL